MSPETEKKTKICPTCGTRLSENATRCLVCGTELHAKAAPVLKKTTEKQTASPAASSQPASALQAGRMPEITLSLPAALGALVALVLIGASIVYIALASGSFGATLTTPTAISSPTNTATITPTATDIFTPTLNPTATLQPPFEYVVKEGDTCGGIAFAFNVSVQSIILLNSGIDAACSNLRVGQTLQIPYPTATPPPLPTSTLDPTQAAKANCDTATYTVQANDTLSSIAANYNVPMAAIMEFNNMSNPTVYVGQVLLIPLCARAPTAGPTPTPTLPPPYPAPNLLLPVDGAAFTLAHDIVTLQWASLGTLRDGEAYQIIVEDVTADQGRRIVDYVTDTKYIVPTNFRPNDTVAHIMRWWVTPVRQTGVDDFGDPVWSPAGAASEKRVFTWIGVVAPATPAP
ncbi:MAG: LysM peptidoglycan-binding domain-containing protein [Chloroflexota bacterium]